MKLILKRTLAGFAPADENDYELLKKIKLGDLVRCTITKERNLGFHRKFFKMVRTVFENQSEFHLQYEDEEAFLDAMKIRVGHVDRIPVEKQDGSVELHLKPRSISFKSMSQFEFEEFYHRCLQNLIEYHMPGSSADEIDAHVNELVGFL